MGMPETDPLIHWARRAAVKRFDPSRSIPDEPWESILRAIELAPSSYGLQPYRVIDVRDTDLRLRLRPACHDQPQIVDADRFLVFAVLTDFGKSHLDAHLARTALLRGALVETLAAYRAKVIERVLNVLDRAALLAWQARQAYIGLAAAMYQAAMRGIDTCPMEAMVLPEVDRLLGLPQRNLTAIVGLALGYRAAEDTYSSLPKVRLPREDFVLEL
jgi:nitroreductase / dihydropteridine reductase